jgi:hypothetical protein
MLQHKLHMIILSPNRIPADTKRTTMRLISFTQTVLCSCTKAHALIIFTTTKFVMINLSRYISYRRCSCDYVREHTGGIAAFH